MLKPLLNFWEDKRPENEKKALEAEEKMEPTWHAVSKEYFEKHQSPIKFLGCTPAFGVAYYFLPVLVFPEPRRAVRRFPG